MKGTGQVSADVFNLSDMRQVMRLQEYLQEMGGMNYFIHPRMDSVCMLALGGGCSSQKNIGQIISDFNWYILLYRIMISPSECCRMF